MLRGARQQQQAGGFERRRGHDHDLRLGLVALARGAVEEGDAPRPAGVLVDQDLMRGRVGPDRQVPGVHRWVDEPGGRVEHRVDIAPAPPLAGTPAVAPAPIPVVLQAVGSDAGAIGGQDPSCFLQALAQLHLTEVELRGTLKLAVRQVRQVLLDAGNAEVEVDLVVIRLQVGV